MKKTLLITFSLISFSMASIAQIANFDAINLDSTGVWNGSDLTGDFEDAGFSFENHYDTAWSYWASGFAVSNHVDNTTPGYINMYSVIAAEAYSGSNFAVSNNYSNISFEEKTVDGFYVNNSTYTALSMLHGDDFSKKFGGETGDDPDWFKLSVIGKMDSTVIDTVEFFLADFRFEDNSQDYIVEEWSWVDLNSLGNITSLHFVLTSSDNGDWGINTPAFFCMDNLEVNTVDVPEYTEESLRLYPNPVRSQIVMSLEGEMVIFDIAGNTIKREDVVAGTPISVSELKPGIYFVKIGTHSQKIVKL